ncbi:MAG: hypothetical protein JEY96_10690 [Bacteroidales bacterium]|nr:hypothetical protein [Bacteroidales bacterium]
MKNFNEKLEELKGNTINPFSVPKDYFEEFPTRIQEKIVSEKKELSWAMRVLYYVKPHFALGFMIIAFAAISITAVDFILSGRNEAGLGNELFTRTIEVDAYEFTEQHFIDVLLEDKKDVIEKKEIETDHYINYLVNEDIDYGTLIDEL